MIPHHTAVLLAGFLSAFGAGVAVASVLGWVFRDRIKDAMRKRRDRQRRPLREG